MRKPEAFERRAGTEFEQPNSGWIIVSNSPEMAHYWRVYYDIKCSWQRKHLMCRTA